MIVLVTMAAQGYQIVGVTACVIPMPANDMVNIQFVRSLPTDGTLVIVATLNDAADVVPSVTAPAVTSTLPAMVVGAARVFAVSCECFMDLACSLTLLGCPVATWIILWVLAAVFYKAVFVAVHLVIRLGGAEYIVTVAASNILTEGLCPQSLATTGRAGSWLVGLALVLPVVILIWECFLFAAEVARKGNIWSFFSTASLVKFGMRSAVFPVTSMAAKPAGSV